MALVPDYEEQAKYKRLMGQEDFSGTDAEFGELIKAAYRTENTFGSLVAKESGLPNSVVNNDSFNPWDHLSEDEKLDDKFVSNVIYADNEEEIDAVRRQSERERKDRALLANSGAEGFFAGLAAGVIDPINFIPVGGTTYKTYRTGSSILKAAAATGSVAAGSQAAVEAALHYSQIERTYGESAANVGFATFLGGFIGAAPPVMKQMLTPSNKVDFEDSMNPEVKVAAGENSVLKSGEAKSAGAAAVDYDIQVQGKIARAMTKALGWDPLSRSITSELMQTRQLAVELAENPISMESKSGLFSVNPVESMAKIKDGMYYEAVQAHDDAFKAYKKAGGALKRKDFNEQVSIEMRNPSTTDPHIKSSAEAWRAKLYDPLKNELVDNGLLPKDVDVATATNYLNRVWNKEKVRANLDDFVNVVSAWLRDQDGTGQPVSNFEPLAREISSRITGTPDGRLPYDYKIGENSSKGGGRGAGLKGPLKERSFNIPDDLVDRFLENDVEQLGGRYLNALAVDIELVKKFGDINMTEKIKEISDAWDAKIQEASKKNQKEARKLAKKKDADIRDITAMRDRMRGVYGRVDPDNLWVRAGRISRDLNYLRFMGGVTVSSIPDVARVVMSEGIAKTFSKGLAPLVSNTKAFKLSAAEAKKYGIGTDVLMGGRSEIIADVADYSQGGSAFERGLRSASQSFGRINLMDYWTGSIKQLHAVVTQSTMADTLVGGGYDKRMAQLGIIPDDGKAIAEQLKKYGQKEGGTWIANTRLWDNQELASIWGAALRKESDRVIVVPGQEKPLFMSNELGKTIFQFRSFMFSATQRMLISGIQGQDQHFMQGVLALTSLGMMSYAFKQWDAGRELSDDPADWVLEGIDRSGVTGIIMEMNNTLEKVSANNYGLRPLLGVTTPSSRFASRSQAEAFLGPTFGSLLSTTLTATGGLSDGEITEADIRTMRRLIPYQNLLIFRQGIDKLEEGIQQ